MEEQEKQQDKASPVDAVVMPCPRLELEWHKIEYNWYKRECVYSLVLPLREYDVRKENEGGEIVRTEIKSELGRTTVSGGNGKPPIWDDGTVDMPYRDGAHAFFDQEALGLHIPVVAVCGDVFSVRHERA